MNNSSAAAPLTDPRKFYVSWHDFHRDARALAWNLPKKDWKGIIAIARGGLFPATVVARELHLHLIDTICFSSYDDKTDQQTDLTLFKDLPPSLGDGEGWLVIDDLVDTGNTIKAVRSRLPKAHYACMYAKSHGKVFVDTFLSEINAWIVFPWEMDIDMLLSLGRY